MGTSGQGHTRVWAQEDRGCGSPGTLKAPTSQDGAEGAAWPIPLLMLLSPPHALLSNVSSLTCSSFSTNLTGAREGAGSQHGKWAVTFADLQRLHFFIPPSQYLSCRRHEGKCLSKDLQLPRCRHPQQLGARGILPRALYMLNYTLQFILASTPSFQLIHMFYEPAVHPEGLQKLE